MNQPQSNPPLRNVYSVAEFAAEILCGKRTAKWVRAQCRRKRIKSVASHPYVIPQSEAARFINPDGK
jgi:hypothetical protein